MNHLALLNPAEGITTRDPKTQWHHIYFVLELLLMALVPSDTAVPVKLSWQKEANIGMNLLL